MASSDILYIIIIIIIIIIISGAETSLFSSTLVVGCNTNLDKSRFIPVN